MPLKTTMEGAVAVYDFSQWQTGLHTADELVTLFRNIMWHAAQTCDHGQPVYFVDIERLADDEALADFEYEALDDLPWVWYRWAPWSKKRLMSLAKYKRVSFRTVHLLNFLQYGIEAHWRQAGVAPESSITERGRNLEPIRSTPGWLPGIDYIYAHMR
jgi:hypothetical protein